MSSYYSFDELKDALGLSDDEIKKMVSEGELRAFRDEDKMKFKREDVEALRRSRGGADDMEDDDIILLDDEPSGGADALTEELILEDDDDFDLGGSSTEALDAQDTFVEGEVGGATEPIEVIEDEDEDEVDAPAAVSTASRRIARARATGSQRLAAVAAPSPGIPWVTGVLIGGAACLLYGSIFMIGLVGDSNPGATRAATDKVYEWVHDSKPPTRTIGDGR